jgi:hypothetical protein
MLVVVVAVAAYYMHKVFQYQQVHRILLQLDRAVLQLVHRVQKVQMAVIQHLPR